MDGFEKGHRIYLSTRKSSGTHTTVPMKRMMMTGERMLCQYVSAYINTILMVTAPYLRFLVFFRCSLCFCCCCWRKVVEVGDDQKTTRTKGRKEAVEKFCDCKPKGGSLGALPLKPNGITSCQGASFKGIIIIKPYLTFLHKDHRIYQVEAENNDKNIQRHCKDQPPSRGRRRQVHPSNTLLFASYDELSYQPDFNLMLVGAKRAAAGWMRAWMWMW